LAKKNDGEERKLPPSDKKLRDLRRDGSIPVSAEFRAGVTFTIVALVGVLFFGQLVDQMLLIIGEVGGDWSAGKEVPIATFGKVIFYRMSVVSLIALVIGTLSFTLASMFEGRGFVWSSKRMSLQFERINPVEGIKKLFDLSALVDLLRSFIKLVILSAAFWLVMRYYLNDIFWAPTCELGCVGLVSAHIALWLLAIVSVVLMVSGFIDLRISRWLFKRDNRMSIRDVKRENKDSFGDPLILKNRKEERSKISQSQPLRGMEHASFVMASEFGSAVAIAYDPELSPTPFIVAKAGDESERQTLIAEADSLGKKIYVDDQLVMQLSRGAALGEPIPHQTYDRVAAYLVMANMPEPAASE
jgi:type III secretion protein U